MTSVNQRFFETEDEKVVEKYTQQGISVDFKHDNKSYYSITAIEYNPSEINEDEIDDEDLDVSNESDNSIEKMNNLAKLYIASGLNEVKYEEYKALEKSIKEAKEKPFLENLTPAEKMVYEKTREFINEYDLSSSDKVSFLMSLRKLVIKEEEFSIYSLEYHADKNRKNIDEIFDAGHQEMIVHFFNELVNDVKSLNKPKIKM